jgi:hypothetical protein
VYHVYDVYDAPLLSLISPTLPLPIPIQLRFVIPQAVQALREPSGEFEGVKRVQRVGGSGISEKPEGSPGDLGNASGMRTALGAGDVGDAGGVGGVGGVGVGAGVGDVVTAVTVDRGVPAVPAVAQPALKGVNLQYVLYTDVDVHFLGDVNTALRPEHMPEYVACAIQGHYGTTRYKSLTMYNAGVMVMNVPGYSSVFGQFREAVLEEVGRAVKGHYWVGSQGTSKSFFPIKLGTWDYILALFEVGLKPSFHTEQMATYNALRLPKELEWEPYLGVNPHALLLHWHGPKLKNVKDCDANAMTMSQRLDGLASSSDPMIQLLVDFKPAPEGYAAAVTVFQHYYSQLCGVELDLGSYGEHLKSQSRFSCFPSSNCTQQQQQQQHPHRATPTLGDIRPLTTR